MKTKYCPQCRRKRSVNYFAKNRCSASGYQSRCLSCLKRYRRQRRKQDQEAQRRWRRKNAESAKLLCRKYHHRHRVKRLRSMRTWQQINGNGYAAVKRWRAKNPEAVLVLNENRRCREREAKGSFTKEEWIEKCNEYGQRCAYCGRKRKLTVQHVKPISKRGSNFISNIVPACQSCNSRIGDREIHPKEVIPLLTMHAVCC